MPCQEYLTNFENFHIRLLLLVSVQDKAVGACSDFTTSASVFLLYAYEAACTEALTMVAYVATFVINDLSTSPCIVN